MKEILRELMLKLRPIIRLKAFIENMKRFFELASEHLEAHCFFLIEHKKNHFCIVSTFYNAGTYVIENLDSVYNQRYRNYEHILINDVSTDNSDELVRQWLLDHPDHKVKYISNSKRVGGCCNNTRGFRMASPGSIVVELNGDDWFPNNNILSFLNKVYCNSNVWMTYNTVMYKDGSIPQFFHKIPDEIIAKNAFRDIKWVASALHTFKAELFAHVKENDLIDPQTGDYWESAWDNAHYLPMFEMAGHHSKHLSTVTYVYNELPSSHSRSSRTLQMGTAQRIRKLNKYQPLEKL